MKALLMLEDGWSCECKIFSGRGEVFGELVTILKINLLRANEIIITASYHSK